MAGSCPHRSAEDGRLTALEPKQKRRAHLGRFRALSRRAKIAGRRDRRSAHRRGRLVAKLERETVPSMDPISFRMRHLLAFVVVAGITAAVLRHFFHVDVGLSREEIRTGALIVATVGIFLVVVLFRRKRRP
jgi:hypothetical protein